jgi:hypothetical protein
MSSTMTRVALVATLVAAGVGATAGPVAAAPARSGVTAAVAADPVAELKASVTARIDLRLAALDRFDADITAARRLTDAHRSQLSTVVSTDVSGLTALKTKVAGETTVAALHDDAASMVNDYRVYTLVGPQVRLTIAGDVEDLAIGKAQDAHDKLADLVAQKKAAGTDTTTAEQDLADMQAAIDAAKGHLDGQVAALLAIQPSPDGAAMKNAVTAVRIALESTHSDLRTAVSKGRAVLQFLRTT